MLFLVLFFYFFALFAACKRLVGREGMVGYHLCVAWSWVGVFAMSGLKKKR